MRRDMKRGLITSLAFVVLGAGVTISASTLATEKSMAGLNLSLDKYTDAMLEEENTENSQEEVAVAKTSARTDVSVEEASSEDTADQNKAEKKDEAEDKEEAKDEVTEEEHLKLNLVYDRLGVANVKSYLNVRSKPSKNGKIVGKMTRNSGCHIYKIKDGWAKIVSGQVNGWVKASFLLKDKAAEEKAKEVATLRINVTTETLNVRFLPSTDSRIYDQISQEDEYDIAKRKLTKEWVDDYIARHCKKSDLKGIKMDDMYDDLSNWMCVRIDRERVFVSKDFVEVTYNLDRAVSIKEPSQKSGGSKGSSGSGSSDSSTSLRSSMVSFAMQYLGNRYVYGGTSLTSGTDCSGFTMRIYEHFGYSLPRTSSAQASYTRSISSSEARPGDLFFYGSGGSVSHVAMYIGNGQIIHASNERTGIKISSAYYRTPIKIGRVIG